MAARRLRTGTLAGTLAGPVLLVALTGCGDDDSVADPPVSSATSSPTQSPQRESPERFIRRFVALSNAMERGGGTKEYLAMTDNCRPCRDLAKQIDEARSSGGFYRSRGWTIRSIHSDVAGGSGSIDLSVTSAPTDFRTSARAQTHHYTGGRFTFRISLRRSSTEWRVTNVAQVAT